MRKGFVVTISTILLLMAVMLFSRNNERRLRRMEGTIVDVQSIDSAAYVFDDVASDMRYLLGPTVEISRNSSDSNITFRERLPRADDDALLLSNYSEFIANYSAKMNSEVSLNLSRITGGKLIVFSNGLGYDRNSTSVRFYSVDGGTNASAYELTIFSDGYRGSENISSLSQAGSAKLTIHYSDLGGSIDVSGAFDPNSEAVYSATYSGSPSSVLLIRVGKLSGSSGSMAVEQGGSVQSEFNLTASGGWKGVLAYAYNADMNYRQLNVSKEDLLWVERG